MRSANLRTLAAALVAANLTSAPLAAQQSATFDQANRVNVGDWAVECLEGYEAVAGQCQLYQRILTQDPSTAALIAALAWSPSDKALLAQVSLPLGSDLTTPPALSINGEPAATFTWSRCLASGCMIEAPLPEALVAALQIGQSASFTVVQPNAGAISIPLSLNGFAEGLEMIMPEGAVPAGSAAESE